PPPASPHVQKTKRRDEGNAGAWPRLAQNQIYVVPQNQGKTMNANTEPNTAPKAINGGFLETLVGHRKLRAERSTSAFCSIWRRTGSSMGARCSSGFGVSPRLRI